MEVINKIKEGYKNRTVKNKQDNSVFTASHSKLIWMNFKKHRLAMISIVVLLCIYIIAIFPGFFSPNDPAVIERNRSFQPPQGIHFFSDEGFSLRPFVYGYKITRDPRTLSKVYGVDKSQKYYLYLFQKSWKYKILGIFETDIHLFGTKKGHVNLLGADALGRDMLSRIFFGAQISSSIGFIGVIINAFMGLTMGGIAGLRGGRVDNIIQRLMELLRSIPRIPLWMGLSAALPPTMPPVQVYIAIVIILSLTGWTQLGRVVRSKFLSLKNEDFVILAKLAGASEFRIVTRHMIPSFISHIIAALTLAIPQMIIAETSLSFLGIGLRPPIISWGVLLQSAQNIKSVARAPWLLLPGVAVIIAVLAFNYIGDGLRDAADPYNKGRG